MNSTKKILVAPLDWGLGHAARCIPLVRRELKRGHEVVIAAEGPGAALLKRHFPELRNIPLRGYRIRYSKRLPLMVALLIQLPKVLVAIRKEHRWLNHLLQHEHFDHVISDNRYGLWNRQTYCSIVTHQLSPQLPVGWKFLQAFVNRCVASLINRFDDCLVPDIEGEHSISGRLSQNSAGVRTVRHIGWLSRFDNRSRNTPSNVLRKYEHLILLSGPEPQRSVLEALLFTEAKSSSEKTLIVRGQPDKDERTLRDGVELWSHASNEELHELLLQADHITCRSGYSTLMDLVTLGVKAELIPTPGQTEQEYLAQRMHALHGWTFRVQSR